MKGLKATNILLILCLFSLPLIGEFDLKGGGVQAGMVVGSGITAGAGASCSASPFISQTVTNDQQSASNCVSGSPPGLFQLLKASDINGKTVCKVCFETGTINTSPWVGTIGFINNSDGVTQYGDASPQFSASTGDFATPVEQCVTWTTNMPALPNADVRMQINTVSGDARVMWSTTNTSYQNTSYDAWCAGTDMNSDIYMKVYSYE